MEPELRDHLLGALTAKSVVFLCGAGLSRSPPSNLMTAVAVARACYDKYFPIVALPEALRDDLDALAGHFFDAGSFQNLFISTLVPWDDLAGEPNDGHASVGDLLLTRSAHAALSANFDVLIEQWCHQNKVSMRGAISGQEAVAFTTQSSPLLKFHGCMQRLREKTLWTTRQLVDHDTSVRIQSCSNWMSLNLPGKDLIVAGFWTDWGYLNDVLAAALAHQQFTSVTVVDPLPTNALQQRAPGLWASFNQSPRFVHVPESANEFLGELRQEFSKAWTRSLFAVGQPLYEGEKGPCPAPLLEAPNLSMDELYDFRRDAEGVPGNRAARKDQPGPENAQAGLAHLLLRERGATHLGAWYELEGRTIRVVQGAGEGLSTVKSRFVDAPSVVGANVVICAGSTDQGVPGHVIRNGQGTSSLRPEPGIGSYWVTLDTARAELQL